MIDSRPNDPSQDLRPEKEGKEFVAVEPDQGEGAPDQLQSSYHPVIRFFIKTLLCVLMIAAASYGLWYFCETRDRIVSFKDVPGLSNEAVVNVGKLYRVEDEVIFHPRDKEHPYTFMVTPLDSNIFKDIPLALNGKPEDFNLLVHELVFLKDNFYSLGFGCLMEVGEGGIDSISNTITGIFNIIFHPLEAIKAVFTLGEKTFELAKQVTSGEMSLEDVKKSAQWFAEMYWYDLCSRRAESYGLDYSKIIFLETRNVVDNYAKAYLAGEATADVAVLYFSFAKVAKVSKMKQGKTIAGAANLFKYTKTEKLAKPLSKFGEAGKSHYASLVSRTKVVDRAIVAVQSSPVVIRATGTTTRYIAIAKDSMRLVGKNIYYPARGFVRKFSKFKIYDKNGVLIGEFKPTQLYDPEKVVKMPFEGLNGGTARGYMRNSKFFWERYAGKYGDDLSEMNKMRIKAGQAPVVDDAWVATHPTHKEFIGDTLHHHHLDHGGSAAPLPAGLHNGKLNSGVWHYE